MSHYLDTLNEHQKQAAEHKDGPMLVLAGAGSGKTYTMTVRMKHLIEHHKIKPENILGITFTVKAANEMKERAIKLVGHQGRFIHLSTFHSLCVRILRQEIHNLKESKKNNANERGYDSAFTIMDSKDQLQLIKEAMKELDLDTKEYSPNMFQGWISSFKNELMSPEILEKSISLVDNPFVTYFKFPPYIDMDKSISMARRVPKIFHGLVQNIYKRYMNKLVMNNSCDFDDLIMLTARLFIENPTVLGHYQEKFKYIMVDEYQDTNHAQYILVKLLAAKYKNISVIGDDFQCLLPNTMISTPNGKKKISDLSEGDTVYSLQGTSVVEDTILSLRSKTVSDTIYTIVTNSGHTIKGTGEHCVFAIDDENSNAPVKLVVYGNEDNSHLFGVNGKAHTVDNMESVWDIREDLKKMPNSSVSTKFGHSEFNFTNLKDIKVGDIVPVCSGQFIYEEEIVSVSTEDYVGYVYDLDTQVEHNYFANDIVVHNCIYGFRNADLRNILEFEKDYVGAKTVKLERNYRSTQKILDRANLVISHNTKQRKKTLWTDKVDGDEVIYHICQDNYAEAEYIAQQIKSMYPKRSYKDFTILYRVNAQSRSLEDVFMKHGIPYDLVGSVNFYDRREIKDIIAYLKVIENPSDEISVRRVINTPKRGIGKSSIDKVMAHAQKTNTTFWEALQESSLFLPAGTVKKIDSFLSVIQNIKNESEVLGVGMLVDVIVEDTGYKKELKGQGTPEAEDRIENLNEFLNVAWEYQQNNEESSIQGFLEQVTLVREEEREKPDDERDFVRMMTIHASKGLEFPVVFGIGLEEKILPYSKSISEDNVEEERRLCYVLATRAKERLYFLRALERRVFNDIQMNEPSRFIEEMGFEEPSNSDKSYVLPW